MDLLKLIGFGGGSILLLFSLLYFYTGFVAVNNPESTVSTLDPLVSETLSDVGNRTEELNSLKDSSANLLSQAELSPTYLFVIFSAAFYIPLGMLQFLMLAVYDALKFPFTVIAGASSSSSPVYTIFNVLIAVIIITVVTVIVREARTGRS